MSGEDLRNDPNWRSKAPYGLKIDGTAFSREEFEALKTKPTSVIKVTVDSKQMEELIEQKKSVEEERDDLAEKLDLIATNAFEKKRRELNCTDDSINTPEKLEAWSKGHNPNNSASGGSATLEGQYGNSQNQGANSMEGMIDGLNDRCSAANKNMTDRKLAIAQREEFLKKNFRGQLEANRPFNYSPKEGDKGTLSMLKEKFERRKALARGEQ